MTIVNWNCIIEMMKCSSNMTCLGGRFMKSKKMLKRMIAAALSTAVMLTAVAPVTNA